MPPRSTLRFHIFNVIFHEPVIYFGDRWGHGSVK